MKYRIVKETDDVYYVEKKVLFFLNWIRINKPGSERLWFSLNKEKLIVNLKNWVAKGCPNYKEQKVVFSITVDTSQQESNLSIVGE